MKIGIDISQVAYKDTGVAHYVGNLVRQLLAVDTQNEYVLFYSSLRKSLQLSTLEIPSHAKVTVKQYKFPQTFLDILWNRLHIVPIEWFVGKVDIFLSSDWLQPPTLHARKATILYDLIVFKYPEETADKIVEVQKRRLEWVKKECDAILCISEATKKDAMEILQIEERKLHIVYPGI